MADSAAEQMSEVTLTDTVPAPAAAAAQPEAAAAPAPAPVEQEASQPMVAPADTETSLPLQATPSGGKKAVQQKRTKTPHANRMVSRKGDNFARAVEDCKALLEVYGDKEIKGAWLLLHLNHWFHEKERVVLLTDRHVISVQYDFVKDQMGESVVLVALKHIKSIQSGELKVNTWSVPFQSSTFGDMFCKNHHLQGVRLHLGRSEADEELSMVDSWNPSKEDLPFVTFRNHETHNEKRHGVVPPPERDVSAFRDAVAAELNADVVREEAPIVLEATTGIFTSAYNDSFLGCQMERNGIVW